MSARTTRGLLWYRDDQLLEDLPTVAQAAQRAEEYMIEDTAKQLLALLRQDPNFHDAVARISKIQFCEEG